MRAYKQHFALLGIVALLAVFLREGTLTIFSIPLLHAQEASGGDPAANLSFLATMLSFFLTFLQLFGFLALMLVDYFLRPEFLSNLSMMGPNGTLKTVWVLSRDIVNLLYAVMLIGVAFYTIVMGNSAKIKEYIIYFVVGLVLVNFSWFFPRVIIDVAHVLTATVYAIPQYTALGNCTDLTGKPCAIITKVTVPAMSAGGSAMADTCMDAGNEYDATMLASGNYCQCIKYLHDPSGPDGAIVCWNLAPFQNGAAMQSNAMINGLIVNYGRIANLSLVPASTGGAGLTDPGASGRIVSLRFLLTLAFSTAFAIIMIFPLLALAAGLVLRILILWICIAFMPFTFLGFVINKGKLGTNIFGFDINIWDEFVTSAFMPFMVALPITVGFIMINAGSGMMAGPVADLPITFEEPLISGIDNWWKFMWMCFALIIVWIGAFTALKKSKLIGMVSERIKNYGESAMGIVAKAPLFVPLPFAGPGGRRMNLGQAVNIASNSGRIVDEAILSGKRFNDIVAEKFANPTPKGADVAARNMSDGDTVLVNKALDKIAAKDTQGIKELRDVLARLSGRNLDTLSEKQLLDFLQEMRNTAGTKAATLDAGKITNANNNFNVGTIRVEASSTAGNVRINGNDVSVASLRDSGAFYDQVLGSGNAWLKDTAVGKQTIQQAIREIEQATNEKLPH